MNETSDPRRYLPSVDKVLKPLDDLPAMAAFSHDLKVDAIRKTLERLRSEITDGTFPSLDAIVRQVSQLLESRQAAGLRKAVNAAGIILHTGLGRAVLPKEAIHAVTQLDGYCTLQIDLETGERGRREGTVEELIRTITGAEAATVVNNNAAATLLVLAALCSDHELIVSRGQLIEIGGSFRLPDVIAQSGARMVEVGTTNKTHLRDYENAITSETRVLLRVNPSNYRIIGFSKQVPTQDLVTLKKDRDLLVIDDLGCGALLDLSKYGLPKEPTVQDSIEAGADVALFSGDKLIGGPQAGIIVGRKTCLDKIRKHPLMRAMRVGKFTIAALEATLKLFLNPETLAQKHPVIRMIVRPIAELRQHAESLHKRLSPLISCEITPGESVCGGGSLPDSYLETALVTLQHERYGPAELARRLRLGDPPIVTRIHDDRVCIDVRTLLDGDDERIENALKILNQ